MSFMFNGNNVGGIKQFYGVCLVFFSPQGQNPDEHTWQDFGFQERDKGRELEGVSERRQCLRGLGHTQAVGHLVGTQGGAPEGCHQAPGDSKGQVCKQGQARRELQRQGVGGVR